jgi:hypothetical protein
MSSDVTRVRSKLNDATVECPADAPAPACAMSQRQQRCELVDMFTGYRSDADHPDTFAVRHNLAYWQDRRVGDG